MDIENLRKYQPASAEAEKSLWDYFFEQESRGKTLVTLTLTNERYDEQRNEVDWDKAVVKDWRTGAVLGEYDQEAFGDLSFTKQGWFDVEHFDVFDG